MLSKLHFEYVTLAIDTYKPGHKLYVHAAIVYLTTGQILMAQTDTSCEETANSQRRKDAKPAFSIGDHHTDL